MKQTSLLLILVVLAACERPTAEWNNDQRDLKSIKGLEDCSYHQIFTGTQHLHVIRCPHSATSTQLQAKSPINSIVVDGEEYVKKETAQ